MTIKTMTALLDLSEKRPATALAVDLAKRLGADLAGIAPIFDPIIPAYAATPMPAEFIVAAREQAVEAAEKSAKAFKDMCAKAGVKAESRIVDVIAGGYFDAMLGYCRLSDLVVVGQDDPEEIEPARIPVIEAVLFRSGAPLLLVPRAGAKSLAEDSAMVAWDGSGPAARAIRGAMPLLARAKTVEVVSIGDSKPGNDGPDPVAYLAAHGIKAAAKFIERGDAGIAEILIGHAQSSGAGFMVMGGYGHSRLREFVLGGTTRHMIDAAQIPVLMAH